MLSSTFVFFGALFQPHITTYCGLGFEWLQQLVAGCKAQIAMSWPCTPCTPKLDHVIGEMLPEWFRSLPGTEGPGLRMVRSVFAIVWRGNVLMTPLAWEYWGPPIHPRMRVSWILMTLVVFLMLLCFCSMVFCVLTCLSSFLSRWRRRSQSYNSHRRNFVGDKEPNAFKTQVHHDPSDPCMVYIYHTWQMVWVMKL